MRGISRSKLKNEQFPQAGAARRGKLIAHYTNEVLRLRGHLAYKPVEDALRLIDLGSEGVDRISVAPGFSARVESDPACGPPTPPSNCAGDRSRPGASTLLIDPDASF